MAKQLGGNMLEKLITIFLILFIIPLYGESLFWLSKSVDIETTTSKEKKTGSFEYENKGSKTIIFTKVKASCGCVLVDAPKEVKPGEKGSISFKAPVPVAGKSLIKTITVVTDESKESKYYLRIKVENTDKPVKIENKVSNKSSEKLSPTKLAKNSTIKKGYTRPSVMNARAKLVEGILAKQALSKKSAFILQKECPFLPLEINSDLFYDYKGLRIFTCCENCLETVKTSPDYAIIKLSEKKQTPVLIDLKE